MNLALRLFAGVIDLLQFIFFIVLLAFQFITPVGGGITGAATGAYFCYNATNGVISGVLEGLKCAVGGGLLGGGLSAIAAPVGIAIDMALSCTFGLLLILILWVTGRFSFMAIVFGFGAEMLPGIDAFVPGWSLLTHRCIQQYKLKQSLGVTSKRASWGVFGSVIKALPGGSATIAALGGAPGLTPAIRSISNNLAAAQQNTRIPLQTKTFDGIRRPATMPQ